MDMKTLFFCQFKIKTVINLQFVRFMFDDDFFDAQEV